MKKVKSCMKKVKSSSLSELPPEVWTQIFATLRVKTLLRVRCVCKSWCSIIDDPRFTNIHLERCAINVRKNKLLLSVERSNPFGFAEHMTVRRADTLRTHANIFFKGLEINFIYGNCDGLLLMCGKGCDDCLEMTIYILSCRKSLLLPPCPFPEFYFRLSDYILIFGFASQSKDYKVILITIEKEKDPKDSDMMNFAVYTLSDHRWNVRNNGSGISREYFRRMFEPPRYRIFDCYFQGAAHWFGNDPYGDGNCRIRPTHLVSLDFNSEKFTFLKLPYTSGEEETLWFMFILRESLAIFRISSASSNIWVLEQDSGKREWTLWLSGFSSEDGFNLFKFYSRLNTVVFYYESGDGSRFLRCGKKSYNLADCRVQMHDESIIIYGVIKLQNYSESLVLHKGYGAEDLPWW